MDTNRARLEVPKRTNDGFAFELPSSSSPASLSPSASLLSIIGESPCRKHIYLGIKWLFHLLLYNADYEDFKDYVNTDSSEEAPEDVPDYYEEISDYEEGSDYEDFKDYVNTDSSEEAPEDVPDYYEEVFDYEESSDLEDDEIDMDAWH